MSKNGKRRNAANERARYTEEPHWAAAPGIDRGMTHGLDTCTPEQRRFRALFALFALNTHSVPPSLVIDGDDRALVTRGVSRLMCYNISFSPRYNDFVVLSDIHDHIIQSVISSSVREHGIPGLRPADADPNGAWLLFRHMPTGATLRFQYLDRHDKFGRIPRYWDGGSRWPECRRDRGISLDERESMRCVPPMSNDAERLLAGLASRLWTRSEAERWGVGGLVWYPFQRGIGTGSEQFTYLWGRGNDWVLRWGGPSSTPASHVAKALTHEVIGIQGAMVLARSARQALVQLGEARLRLEFRYVNSRSSEILAEAKAEAKARAAS
jgi:hypothetical protein